MNDVLKWVNDHKQQTYTGGWMPSEDYGGDYFPVFDTEIEIDDFLIIHVVSCLAPRYINYIKENARLREALSQLVALKDYKDSHGKDSHYIDNQPVAWSRARKALERE